MQRATTTIPIVLLIVGDPVGWGFAKSLARPGGNVTGVSSNILEVVEKRMHLLKELVPSLSRVAVLWNSQNAGQEAMANKAVSGARSLRLQCEALAFHGPSELQSALTRATFAQALFVVADPVTFDQRASIAQFALVQRLAMFGSYPEDAQAGALASYGPNLTDEYRKGATYVDKILRGAKPAELPIEEPTTYELTINVNTAKTLGINIPQSMLLRADKVIE